MNSFPYFLLTRIGVFDWVSIPRYVSCLVSPYRRPQGKLARNVRVGPWHSQINTNTGFIFAIKTFLVLRVSFVYLVSFSPGSLLVFYPHPKGVTGIHCLRKYGGNAFFSRLFVRFTIPKPRIPAFFDMLTGRGR